MSDAEQNQFSSTEEIIEEIRRGRMVIILDDEDRENEGDLIMAGSAITADAINFMARHGRGLICLTLTADRCEQLHLPLMVADNNDKNSTNFTVSIEAAEGVTTGISAADRAATVAAAVKLDAKPGDIVQPGHIFPLKAQPGGVLARAGHTEAGCDLARLAGHEPAAVIVEILNDDGTMARYPDLVPYAKKHGLKMGTIADLIKYRIQQEKSLELCAETPFQTRFGEFELRAYHDPVEDAVHMA
ncbi:MAG: 3,4-dihydroxy-2-butanone-4-phosphate synthase, partial [Gammaproteobacteria bacterium]